MSDLLTRDDLAKFKHDMKRVIVLTFLAFTLICAAIAIVLLDK